MPLYSRITWVDDTTALSAANLNTGEQGIYDLSACAGAAASSPSRALDTTYQNETGQLIAVLVCVTVLNGNATVYTGAGAFPTTETAKVANTSATYTLTMTLCFVVPPGKYYEVSSSGTVALVRWREYTLH